MMIVLHETRVMVPPRGTNPNNEELSHIDMSHVRQYRGFLHETCLMRDNKGLKQTEACKECHRAYFNVELDIMQYYSITIQ